MYQVLIKVPCTQYAENGDVAGQQYSDANEVFRQACAIDSRVGGIHISNTEFTCFGFISENDNIEAFSGLPGDVIITTEEVIEDVEEPEEPEE